MGTRIPCAPESSARLIIHSSPHGIRIMGLAFIEDTAWLSCVFAYVSPHRSVWAVVQGLCSYVVVVVIRDQAVLGVDQDPGEAAIRGSLARGKQGSGNCRIGDAIRLKCQKEGDA